MPHAATVYQKAGKIANRKRKRERQNKVFPQEPTERQIPQAQTRKTQGAAAPEPSPRKKITCRPPQLLFEKKKLQSSVLTTRGGFKTKEKKRKSERPHTKTGEQNFPEPREVHSLQNEGLKTEGPRLRTNKEREKHKTDLHA